MGESKGGEFMDKEYIKNAKRPEENRKVNRKKKSDIVSYRLRCARTANGLSHYIIYGDISDKKALL